MKIVPGTAGGRMVNSAGSPIPAGSLSTIAGGYRDWETDRKSTRLNSSHSGEYRMPSSA